MNNVLTNGKVRVKQDVTRQRLLNFKISPENSSKALAVFVKVRGFDDIQESLLWLVE